MKELQNELTIYLEYKVIHDINKGLNITNDLYLNSLIDKRDIVSNERKRRIVSACGSKLNMDLDVEIPCQEPATKQR